MIELEHGKGSPLKACLVCGNCWPKTKFGLSRKFCFYLIGGQKLACLGQLQETLYILPNCYDPTTSLLQGSQR